jgi:hypothetical protein
MFAIYDIQGWYFRNIPEQTQKIQKHRPVMR